MKLKINYDLLKKINESTNGLKLQRVLTYIYLPSSPFLVLNLINLIKLFKPETLNVALILTLLETITQVPFISFGKFISDVFKEPIKNKANKNLNILVSQLYNLEVKTSTELLKEAKLIKTNYKIKFSDDKLPVLKQKKYINVPLTNGYDKTIMQEHNVGSKNYELSVEEPTKILKFKPVKASI